MKRRYFIKTGLGALALTGAAGSGLSLLEGKGLIPAAAAAQRGTPLPIPPLLENLDKSGTGALFNLNVQQGSRSFFPGLRTPTCGLKNRDSKQVR